MVHSKQQVYEYIIAFRKSTFFNVLTKSAAPAENFPFCTIDPNEARVAVPDTRWQFLCDHHKPARYLSLLSYINMVKLRVCLLIRACMYTFSKVPAFLQVLDIAGLVKGASEGQGLGNAFLSHIKQCDAIFHMSSKFTQTYMIGFILLLVNALLLSS